MERIRRFSAIARRAALLAAAVVFFSLMGGGPEPASAATVTVDVGSFWFCDASFSTGVCETKIDLGDTVSWNFAPGIHTTTECTGACGAVVGDPASREWHSGIVNGGTFAYTFNSAGTWDYQCNTHPTLMRGRVVVNDGSVGGIAELPEEASETLAEDASSSRNVGLWVSIGAVLAAIAVASYGAASWARRRVR